MAQHRLSLRVPRDGVNTFGHCTVHMLCLIVRKRSLMSISRSITCQASVLMMADRILGETTKDFGLFVTETLHPVAHVLHHFALNFGVTVVKFGVEPVI
jgi:hypothetical protein